MQIAFEREDKNCRIKIVNMANSSNGTSSSSTTSQPPQGTTQSPNSAQQSSNGCNPPQPPPSRNIREGVYPDKPKSWINGKQPA